MSTSRRKVADRLVGVKNDTAMLTTFNEVDIVIADLRAKIQEQVKEEKGVGLGLWGSSPRLLLQLLLNTLE